MNKRSFHVDPWCRVRRTQSNFCSEPQVLVNICLTCPLPKCRPGCCDRYNTAKKRLKMGIYPLADAPIPTPVKLSKCELCEFGCDVGGKVFCPLIKGTCVKEGCK